jgi:hypothetical protein
MIVSVFLCLIGERHHDRVVVKPRRGRRLWSNPAKHRIGLGKARAGASQRIGANGIAEGKAPGRVTVKPVENELRRFRHLTLGRIRGSRGAS